MKKLKGYEIRQKWLDFWQSKGHDVIPSASLIPHNDPTLLWINAGVAPLKKYFDGREIPQNRRMTNAQKSIRTNDIENVGKTARHHTFFEMLGNFSVGDYFRNEVLPWAIELLTNEKWFDLDINRLYFTYYPKDLETYNKWIECGVDPSHLIPVDGNFWEIGEGPCGPDTEIFFDRGTKYDKENQGIDLIKNDIENDRYIEIWNIVFSQYNSKPGIPREQYKELPSKNIDTGCGLERVACVMQEVETNYDTDLFMPIIHHTELLTNVKYNGQMPFKVISDHVRSTVFALSDGATFSNEGRGYVLRRILRRAVRYGKLLGMKEPFLYKLVHTCVENMKIFYPYLVEKEELVTKQIKNEEEKFLSTLESGEKRLLDVINHSKEKIISKEFAFQLYDTFGFPLELTLEVASEYGFKVDEEGFKEELQKQKNRARAARNKNQSMNMQREELLQFKDKSEFVGYDTLEINSKVIALFTDTKQVSEGSNKILAVFDKTPFYAQMGGQIGDQGIIQINGETFDVVDTIKLPNGQAGSFIEMEDEILKVNDEVKCIVDVDRRKDIEKNHSATHLLNEALRKLIDPNIYQQGSYVGNELLHFDFNHFQQLSLNQILQIENEVNKVIDLSLPVNIQEMPLEEAKKKGVQAVFGEKYGKIVRVVDMSYSKELCGGTHVNSTKEIEKFVILSVESKGSGIFRITATTSRNINKVLKDTLENINNEINSILDKESLIYKNANDKNISLPLYNHVQPKWIQSYQIILDYRQYLEQLKEECKELEKMFNKKDKEQSLIAVDDFISSFIDINGTKVLIKKIENQDVQQVKDLCDRLCDRYKQAIIFFSILSDKLVFVCKNKGTKLHAGNLVKAAAMMCSGNGGGRPDFAQAGGKDITKVDDALSFVRKEIEQNI